MKRYPREQQLPEIPFDVAEWGDALLPWPDGLFATEVEYDLAAAKATTVALTDAVLFRLCLVLLIVLVLVGCGSKADSKKAANTTTTPTMTAATTTAPAPKASSSRCVRAWKIVDGYNILAPEASRADYLTLLHKLQRDCPTVAAKHGLTGRFPEAPHLDLPECQRLDQENCTMYAKP